MFAQIREQFVTFWENQSATQRIVFIVLSGVAIAAVVFFISWASTPNYVVAYSGLTESDAGQIVEQLNKQGITYKLPSSGTIMVPSEQVYDVRLSMAKDGLPQGGTVGFELFTGNTLGMTEFTQRVNYQQALEGELERTIQSLAAIEAVRVHIVIPEKALLTEDQPPVTCSVTIKQAGDKQLDSGQVKSITHLVASSIENLQAENVVVVDVDGNMLASGLGSESEMSVAVADSHQAAEDSTARQIERDIELMLDEVLGANNSVVRATVEMDWTELQTTSKEFVPDDTAIRSEVIIEENYTTTGTFAGGVPGAEPNLPNGDTVDDTESDGSIYQRLEETTNYEINETHLVETKAAGEIKRVSLSVLVDGVDDEEILLTLQNAISAAAGIDVNRGDTLVVDTLEFDRTQITTQAEELSSDASTDLFIRIGMGAAAVIGLGLLLWYVQRLMKNLRMASADAWTPVMVPVGQAIPSGFQGSPQRTPSGVDQTADIGEIPEFDFSDVAPLAELPEPVNEITTQELMESISIPDLQQQMQMPSPEEEQMQIVLERLADENPASVAEIIQLWLTEDAASE